MLNFARDVVGRFGGIDDVCTWMGGHDALKGVGDVDQGLASLKRIEGFASGHHAFDRHVGREPQKEQNIGFGGKGSVFLCDFGLVGFEFLRAGIVIKGIASRSLIGDGTVKIAIRDDGLSLLEGGQDAGLEVFVPVEDEEFSLASGREARRRRPDFASVLFARRFGCLDGFDAAFAQPFAKPWNLGRFSDAVDAFDGNEKGECRHGLSREGI